MDALVREITWKLKEALASKRVWAVLASNGISLSILSNEWAKATVLAVTAVAYILADTWGRYHPPPKP